MVDRRLPSAPDAPSAPALTGPFDTIAAVSEQPSSPFPSDPSRPAAGEAELSVDLGAFLPEGTELGHDPAPDPWGDATPEPEVPAWARSDDPAAPVSAAGAPADVVAASSAPAVASDRLGDHIDLDALTELERDLDAVDGALQALDAGEPAGSPLLVELLGL